MATLSELQTWLDALRKARASGLRSVQHGDTRTEFKSDVEMAAAIRDLEGQIASASGTRVKAVYFNQRKGT